MDTPAPIKSLDAASVALTQNLLRAPEPEPSNEVTPEHMTHRNCEMTHGSKLLSFGVIFRE